MTFTALVTFLSLVSGGFVGFSLGLIGGGGSILAVPLMVFVVGQKDVHMAIGTSSLAVAVNASVGLLLHARGRTIIWPTALIFAIFGAMGAIIGSAVGKIIDGQRLLLMFAMLMVVVAGAMIKPRKLATAYRSPGNSVIVGALGSITGILSGFFGIGGGFLIVPALMLATGMPILNAIGSSLVAVAAFGLTTATSYAWSNLVDWKLAILFIAGGTVGSVFGTALARQLALRRGILNLVFAIIIMLVAVYIIVRSIAA